jgi:glycosyltransferase involved in cell wall biosynthesis
MNERKIRVLFFVPSLVAGGAERVVTTLLRNLSRDTFDLSLAVVSQKNSVFSGELPADVPIIDLQTPRVRFALWKIIKVIWKLQPDVVFSTIDYFNVTLGLMRPFWPPDTRFIARPTILLSAALSRHRRPLLWRSLHKIALLNTDLMVFQSPEMEQDYQEALGWHVRSSIVIPNPLDFAFVQERAANQATDTGYDPAAFNLVAAGRLEDQKGFDTAIEALALTRNKGIHLTILGDGSLQQSLMEQARALRIQDRVRFLGYRHNPYPFYAHADGFLLSSRFEGFPNVVLEAISCGTPVVATPLPGLTEILVAIPGCRVSTDHTAGALAGAIDQLADYGRQRVKQGAVSRFDAGQVVARYEDLLAEAGRLTIRRRCTLPLQARRY